MTAQELIEIAALVDGIVGTGEPNVGDPAQIDAASAKLVEEAGLWRVAVPEERGGSGGELSHLAVVLRRLGYHGARVPVLEDHLSADLLAECAVALPATRMTFAVRHDLRPSKVGDWAAVSGTCRQVPWSRDASHVVAVAEQDGRSVVLLLPQAAAEARPGANIAGEPRDDLTFDAVEPTSVSEQPGLSTALRARALIYRSLQLLGAGERAVDLTVGHVAERTQFGSPLSRRQVVQHYIAEMFGVLTATRAACDAAIGALAGGGHDVMAAALATRVEADRMASLVSRLAHQLHGAIGFTQEHSLRLSTTRLNAWRQDDLSEAGCALEFARLVPGLGGPWETLTGVRAGGEA